MPQDLRCKYESFLDPKFSAFIVTIGDDLVSDYDCQVDCKEHAVSNPR